MYELHTLRTAYYNTSAELLAEHEIAKESDICFTFVEQSGKEETRAQLAGSSGPTCFMKVEIPMKERKWTSILAYPAFKGTTLSTEISKLIRHELGRHYDQDERDPDGAVHWNSICPKLMRAFGHRGPRKSSEKDWLQNIYEGSSKTWFEYCTDSENS